MAAQDNAAVLALQYEPFRKKLPDAMWEREDVLWSLAKERADVIVTSTRAMRVPVKLRPGGKGGAYSPDAGDLGRGSGTQYDYLSCSPAYFKYGWETTKLVEMATNSDKKALVNAAAQNMADATDGFRMFLDKVFQTGGNGILAVVASGGTTTSLTLGPPNKAQLLYFNQDVAVYDSTLATNRGEITITAIDRVAGTLTVSAGTAQNTDYLVPSGLTGASPSTLFGLTYLHNNSATGTYLTKDRANYPELRCPSVDVASNVPTALHIRLALDKIRKLMGMSALTELIPYMNLEQAANFEQQGLAYSQIIKEGSGQLYDPVLGGKGNDRIRLAGYVPKLSINADPTRIDFISIKNWGRGSVQEVDLFKIGDQSIFPIYGTSGGIKAAWVFYLHWGGQFFNDNPQLGCYLYNCATPVGY